MTRVTTPSGDAEPEPSFGLGRFDLFADCDQDDLGRLEAALEPIDAVDGEPLIQQGEPAEWFALLVEGGADIERTDRLGTHPLGVARPGSILGEIALLRSSSRTATVTARGPIRALVGDAEAFHLLLELPGVYERVTKTAAQELAAQAVPTPVTVKDGRRFLLRPLLPGDREDVAAGIAELSDRSRRMRFFTSGGVPNSIIDYLVDLDYTNHFAWGAFAADPGHVGGGVARYIRTKEDHHTAELAVTVSDDQQGLGLGSTLVGALAAAAPTADVRWFAADVLRENTPMISLLDRADARWEAAEPGVLTASVEVPDARRLIHPDLADTLRSVAEDTVSASHLPLA